MAGATQASTTWPLPGVAVSPVGAPGAVGGAIGVADAGADAGPGPTALAATTVNVYGVPLVSPLTVQPGVGLVHVAPPGAAVAV